MVRPQGTRWAGISACTTPRIVEGQRIHGLQVATHKLECSPFWVQSYSPSAANRSNAKRNYVRASGQETRHKLGKEKPRTMKKGSFTYASRLPDSGVPCLLRSIPSIRQEWNGLGGQDLEYYQRQGPSTYCKYNVLAQSCNVGFHILELLTPHIGTSGPFLGAVLNLWWPKSQTAVECS